MAGRPEANGTTEHGFKAAMVRLLANGAIVEKTERRDRRDVTTIALP